MKFNHLTKKENILITQLILGGVVIGVWIGLLFLFTVASVIGEVPEDQGKFAFMHQQYPIIYFAWSMPIFFGFVTRYFAFVYINKKNEIEAVLLTKNNIITNNALFAKSIGEGDFESSNFGTLNKKDLLTRSLIMMRENLIKNKNIEHQNVWINEGKELISNELRKSNDLKEMSFLILKSLLEYCDLVQGRFYIWDTNKKVLNLNSAYAYNRQKHISQEFKIGEGLIGQAAFEKESIYRTEIPEEYFTITSGILGEKKPGSLFIMPLISEKSIQGVIEVANIDNTINPKIRELIENLGPIIGQVLFSVSVSSNTERLLAEAQILTEELRENEEELHQNAEEMRMTQEELEKSNAELELQVKAVESSKTRLHSLLENASEIITIYDANGRIKYVSPSTEKILGYQPQELLGLNATERIEDEYVDLVKTNLSDLLKNPFKTVSYTFKHIKKDGSEIWVETTGKNMLNNEAIEGLIFNTRDISVQRMAEKDRRLKSQMQALSENSPDLIIRFGKNGKFHYSNPRVTDYLFYSPAELQDQNIHEIEMDDKLKSFLIQQIEDCQSKRAKSDIEYELNLANESRTLKVSSIPEYNDENELETILIVAHDLTEIKAIEKEITEKNLKLTESINYAQRIQTAILPKTDLFNQYFSDSFMFYKARDVVSGDFPWFSSNENGIYLAAVDCTGHGVPGALLSFIGYFLLNNIVSGNPKAKSGEILEQFDKEVKYTLKQENGSRNTRDGMDIAFCQFSTDLKKLHFSGAHRPLYFQRGDELIQYGGNRRAIGGITPKKKIKEFDQHEIDLQKGDRIYIFSDGLSDQFKESSLEKFKEKQIREILHENREKSLQEIHQQFDKRLTQWQGSYRQIDDILLIGIEV